MKILWFYFFFHLVFADNKFGYSYLKDVKLCHQWNCINNLLHLPDALPPRKQTTEVLKSLLPQGAWQDVVESVLDGCYGKRYRICTNTCPGQALLHCIVDHLILNCPDENVRKADACSSLTSLAGFKYMFAQSRYDNLEKILPAEQRPAWFLKHYFNTKCCDLPPLFNIADLATCGFSTIINYYKHPPRQTTSATTITLLDNVKSKVAEPSSNVKHVSIEGNKNSVHMLNISDLKDFSFSSEQEDPLNCCNMDNFIDPAWRSECGFELKYSNDERLIIVNRTLVPPSTTPAPPTKLRVNDIKVLPLSCEKEICIFRRLDIVSESGAVNRDAFMKLLDNITKNQPEWDKAKARVLTKCLHKPVRSYTYDCKINKVLACTFDVLSENCPNATKDDPCKHISRNLSAISHDNMTCQISSSKYGPKNRRLLCELPSFVNYTILKECGVNTFYRTEMEPIVPKYRSLNRGWCSSCVTCKELTHSTKCLLNKMDVLSKYNFIDYFKMKDQIRRFTSNNEDWSTFTDIYLSRFTSMLLYEEYCSSPKKLLNIIDVMLSTCPLSRRKDTQTCNKIFEDIIKTPRRTIKKHKEMLGHFEPRMEYPLPAYHSSRLDWQHDRPAFTVKKQVHKNPLHDFGILNSKNAPPVTIIDVKPREANDYDNRKPSVILPVYLRSDKIHGSLSKWPNDGILRSADPYGLHKQILAAQNKTDITNSTNS
ncbi:uncharacterized protein LOC113229375 isoform X2 [Hyposmocoma kahamanoa]|uniref:uncharacterized protein LOC113229375 isoform X2 n=1 Tax=Hyposmocoma kahamanoa TaxID=1477025 RepID=UPI000E6D7932|nr:uncharacterized protein LOC113229375 isoform X2 [Hyposmocoma kahamanoa]